MQTQDKVFQMEGMKFICGCNEGSVLAIYKEHIIILSPNAPPAIVTTQGLMPIEDLHKL